MYARTLNISSSLLRFDHHLRNFTMYLVPFSFFFFFLVTMYLVLGLFVLTPPKIKRNYIYSKLLFGLMTVLLFYMGEE